MLADDSTLRFFWLTVVISNLQPQDVVHELAKRLGYRSRDVE